MEKKLTDLLKLRNRMKSRKPNFVRQQYNKKKSLGKKWHAPRGMHSKLRLGKKGKLKTYNTYDDMMKDIDKE